MRFINRIVTFTFTLWIGTALGGEDHASVTPDYDEMIAQEIADGAPVDNSGIEGSVLGAIDLASYANMLEGGQLRARELTLLPGGRIGVHAHNHRPAIVYVLEGEFIEHRSDSPEPLVRRKGDTFFEGPGLVHWSENISDQPVRALAVDIVPAQPE